jgi:protein required for attachment to host cells
MRVFEQPGIEPTVRLIETVDHPEGRLMVREIVSDQPGIAESGPLSRGSALGKEESPKRHIEDTFAHAIARFLDHHAHAGDFDTVAIVAEPHLLGRLRAVLGAPARARLRTTVKKDFGYLSDHAVAERLHELLVTKDERPIVEPHRLPGYER